MDDIYVDPPYNIAHSYIHTNDHEDGFITLKNERAIQSYRMYRRRRCIIRE